MEYQKLLHFLDNKPNQPSKFQTKNWVKLMMDHMVYTALVVKLNLKLQ